MHLLYILYMCVRATVYFQQSDVQNDDNVLS